MTELERLARIEAGVESIIRSQEETNRRLFGNGQPGELGKLWSHIDSLKSEVDALKVSRARLEGFARGIKWLWAFFLGLLSLFGIHVVKHQ